jgi:ribosomal protein S18 acetylase RimI-like enzyme
MALIIRRVEVKDVEKLRAIGQGVREFDVSRLGIFWSKKQLSLWSKSKTDLMLIALEEEEIVGFAFFAVHKPTGKATFENLWVHPDFRHHQVARRLMEVSLRELQALKVEYIVALISDSNKPILKFLEVDKFVAGGKVIWIDKNI